MKNEPIMPNAGQILEMVRQMFPMQLEAAFQAARANLLEERLAELEDAGDEKGDPEA